MNILDELPVVELEKWTPEWTPMIGTIPWPIVWKLRLTAASEMAIFGDLNPYRDNCMPALFPSERYYQRKSAIINEVQAMIYNESMKIKCGPDAELIEPGIVEVCRPNYSIKLENI